MTDKGRTRLGILGTVAVWALASGVMVFAADRLVSAVFMPSSWPYVLPIPTVLLLLPLLLILGGPAAVLVIGILKRNLAMIAGPLLLIPILSAYAMASSWLEMRRLSRDVASLDMRVFLARSSRHDLIVQGDSRSTDCDDLCQQILVQTDYRVGVPGYGSKSFVYRKISEPECKDTWYSAPNIRFAGICARIEEMDTVDDALFIVTPGTRITGGIRGHDVFQDLPPIEFTGQAFALVERIPEAPDRILGRWVAGDVSVWPFHSSPIGKSFDRKTFYAAALALSFN